MKPSTLELLPPPDAAPARPAEESRAAGRGRPAGGRTISVIVARTEADLLPHVPAWERLADEAVAPNVFYEPWMLLPALRHFGGAATASLRFVLVLASDPAAPARPPELCGLFPLERRRRLGVLPVVTYRLWSHGHSFLSTPLLRRGLAGECLDALLDHLAGGDEPAGVMHFGDVEGDGPFHHALVDCLARRRALSFVQECHTRAMLRTAESGEAYLRAALSGEDRRAQARRARRMGEAGQMEVRAVGPGDDPKAWAEEFLRLESAGWKGKQNTAAACSPTDSAFVREVIVEAFRRRRLLGLQIQMDGRAIAQRISFTAGAGAFSFKTAFDEAYKRFSPGALLEIENIRHAHSVPHLRWMDSCTRPDNALLNRVWMDRRTIQSVAVATGRAPGGLAVSVLPLLRWANRVVRRPGVS